MVNMIKNTLSYSSHFVLFDIALYDHLDIFDDLILKSEFQNLLFETVLINFQRPLKWMIQFS